MPGPEAGVEGDAEATGPMLGSCDAPQPIPLPLPARVSFDLEYLLQPEPRVLSFTAERDGLYLFELVTPRGPELTITQGPTCDGAELVAVSGESASWEKPRVETYLHLDAGETVLLHFDLPTYAPYEDVTVNVQAIPAPPSCDAQGELAGRFPAWVEGHLPLGRDDVALTCESDPGIETVYRFTAPEAGSYVFEASESAVPVLLAAFDGGTCDGATLGCAEGRLRLDLDAAQTVALVVQATGDVNGIYSLGVAPERGSCRTPVTYADSDVYVDMTFAWNDYDLSALGLGREAAVLYTAPADGRYCARSEQYDVVYGGDLCGEEHDLAYTELVLLDGASCDSSLLAAGREECVTSCITEEQCEPVAKVSLVEGQQVLAVMHASDPTLEVALRIGRCPECASFGLGSALPHTQAVASEDWCEPPLGVLPSGCELGEPAKHTAYAFQVPQNGDYTFEVTAGAVVLGVVCDEDLETSCDGQSQAAPSFTLSLHELDSCRVLIEAPEAALDVSLTVSRSP